MECTRKETNHEYYFKNRISLADKIQSPDKIFQSKGWNESNLEKESTVN